MVANAQAEPRNKRATITLTATEKDAIRLVCTVDGTDESNLLREHTIAQVVARAVEIRRRVGQAA